MYDPIETNRLLANLLRLRRGSLSKEGNIFQLLSFVLLNYLSQIWIKRMTYSLDLYDESVMLRDNDHIHRKLNKLDSGIFHRALEQASTCSYDVVLIPLQSCISYSDNTLAFQARGQFRHAFYILLSHLLNVSWVNF